MRKSKVDTAAVVINKQTASLLEKASGRMKQEEMNGMPEMDECGRCGVELYDVLAKKEQLAIDLRNATEKLIQALKRDKRISIKVKKKTFVLQHMEEADVIKVKK